MKQIIALILITSALTINAQTNSKSPEELSNDAIEQGNGKAESNNWQGALSDYTNAISYNGKNAVAFNKRGVARQNLRDYRGAIMDFSKAIYLNNSDGASYYGRGMCYYMLGQKQKCCLEFTRATEYGYNDAYQAIQNYCN